ncbi:lysosome membrane protein 2-like [Hemiscyllium ocellatum]|uniref:lysosome membrane protein 2-like n=1 Tax=Hemiscyllium ocellatum TaxID=170820 RepID=UPI002967798A|nr:lysosome membrane protein 2-like [Hemiscyllium ocellatum]
MGVRPAVTYTIGILCIILLIASIALLVTNVFVDIVDNYVKKEVQLKNDTVAFETWKNPPPPIYMQFYFFNVTNPEEVLNGGKPFLEEKGPYTYREHKPKENVTFLDDGRKVSAITTKTYVFVPELSNGDPETDLIRTVNIPVVTVMNMVRYSSLQILLLNGLLIAERAGIFTTRTVHELLWGYKDPVLSAIHFFKKDIDNEFGLYYKMNGTDDGEYVFLTGQKSYKNFTTIVEWRGNKSLDWWTTGACNMINGTDGTSFHPLITKNETLRFFSSDLCRSLYANFEQELRVKGIPVMRFVPPNEVFANVTVNPENAGFCVPAGNCLGSGVLNISTCKQGAPIILSSPHFYQADQKFIDDIEGMHPNKANHETFLDINPLTGLLVRAAKRVQVNVYIEPIAGFIETDKVKTLVFPVMYLNESVLIDNVSAAKLNAMLLQSEVITVIPFMIMGLGILFGLIFVILVCTSRNEVNEVNEASEAERTPLLKPS